MPQIDIYIYRTREIFYNTTELPEASMQAQLTQRKEICTCPHSSYSHHQLSQTIGQNALHQLSWKEYIGTIKQYLAKKSF